MARHALRTPINGETAPLFDSTPLVERGRDILNLEINALRQLAGNLDDSFARAVQILLQCQGTVVVSGMGKAGIVGQKLSASFSSTGTPSHFMHPAEAVHGDLGCVRSNDVSLILSYSGETEEVTRILPFLKSCTTAIIAITARTTSTLGRAASVTIPLGEHKEGGEHALAPSTTTTAMLAVGDALTLVVSEQRGFTRDQFARFHPAGNLGRQLTGVCDVMRTLDECRIANQSQSLREVLVRVSKPGRRTGAIMLTNDLGKLVGIFTDSDLARLLERSQDFQLDQSIGQVMTREFTTVEADCMLPEAMRIMSERKISELPVVDAQRVPLGIVDVTDVVSITASKLDASIPLAANNQSDDQQPLRHVLRVVRE